LLQLHQQLLVLPLELLHFAFQLEHAATQAIVLGRGFALLWQPAEIAMSSRANTMMHRGAGMMRAV
jgi:hypothetical protein